MNPKNINQITKEDNSSFPDPNYFLGPSMVASLRYSINHNERMYQSSLAQVSNMVSSIAPIEASDSSATKLSSSSDTTSLKHVGDTYSAPFQGAVKKVNQSPTIEQSIQLILGGVVIPPVPPNSSTATQVHAAAAAAAAAAVPETHDSKKVIKITENLSESQRKRLNRERNKEHAKSTRARKKAYINKLKDLVEGLHAEQATEAMARRIQVQKLADMQRTRRSVLKQFLKYHGEYESNQRKWATILEEDFVLKQPVTPYRSFRRSEIQNSRDRECRKSVGINAVIADSASIAVMIEAVGSRSSRWKSIKRDDCLRKDEIRTGKARSSMPLQIDREDSRLHHAISSLSSSSGYTQWFSSANGSGEEEEGKKNHESLKRPLTSEESQNVESTKRKKNCCSSSSDGSEGSPTDQNEAMNTEFHDYDAKPLPDPKLDRGNDVANGDTASAGSNSLTENDSDNAVVGAEMNTDASSGDDANPVKYIRHARQVPPTLEIVHQNFPARANATTSDTISSSSPIILEPNSNRLDDGKSTAPDSLLQTKLPPNIARTGGIVHNVKVGSSSSNPRLDAAPAIALPAFAGLGKRSTAVSANPENSVSISISNSSNSDNALGVTMKPAVIPISNLIQEPLPHHQPTSSKHSSNLIGEDNDTSSNDSSGSQISAFFHVNEDDMLLTDDVLMCPFIFRTQDAVRCGALAECVMPGMCRAQFSPMNKLISLEMVYDAMGFMQQLGRASGNEGIAEIVPNSLEMSLQPSTDEARVITTAQPPFSIVSANAAWTKITKYSQMEAEQKDLSILNGGKRLQGFKSRQGRPSHEFSSVAEGKPGCSTNIFCDKYGKEFVAFVSSYPLTNMKNDVTHLLHIFKNLNE